MDKYQNIIIIVHDICILNKGLHNYSGRPGPESFISKSTRRVSFVSDQHHLILALA